MNKKTTILQCSREIGFGGGVSVVAEELERQFISRGYNCMRFTIENIKGKNIKSHDASLVKNKLKLLFDVVFYSLFGSFIAKKKFGCNKDVITIAHNDILFGDIYVNHGLHKDMLFSSGSPIKMLLRNPIHFFLLIREWVRFRLKLHTAIICFCNNDAQRLIELYPSAKGKTVVIPNGINLERFKVIPGEKNKVRDKLNIKDDDFCLIFVGHEFERKGLTQVIQSLVGLPPRVKLIVVGGGSINSINQYKNLASTLGVEDKVVFLGTRLDVPSLMNCADLFVLPSKYETWALVGLEAMACGLPVLMTNTGGISEYLIDNENGRFIERNPDDIRDKIISFMNNESGMKKMSNNAINKASDFSWGVISEKYINLINRIHKEHIGCA